MEERVVKGLGFLEKFGENFYGSVSESVFLYYWAESLQVIMEGLLMLLTSFILMCVTYALAKKIHSLVGDLLTFTTIVMGTTGFFSVLFLALAIENFLQIDYWLGVFGNPGPLIIKDILGVVK